MIVYTDKHRVPFEIDDEDWATVSRYSWCIRKGYPTTATGKWPKHRVLEVHLFLLGPAGPGLEWDHIDRNPLNNRRANLRRVAHATNIQNTTAPRDSRSGVKGIRRVGGRWQARIAVGHKGKHLGTFATLEAAKAARLSAEQELWGTVTQ